MRIRNTLITIVLLVTVTVLLVAASAAGRANHGVAELTQTTVNLTPVADASMESAAPDTNFGSTETLAVYYGGQNEIARALIRFNLAAAVPSEAIIDSARLDLFLEYGDGADPVNLVAALLTEDWVESEVTWSTRPATGEPVVAALVDTSPGYKSMDVTDIVQAWHNVPHYGLELSGPEGETVYSRVFESREHGEMPPQLVVTYHLPPPPTDTPTPTSTRATDTPTPTPTSTPTATPTATFVLPSLERTFGGTVYLVESGEQSQPLRGAQVSLYRSTNPSELGELLATSHTARDGTFMLVVYTNSPNDFPYYFLALNDPNYVAVGASPGPGGEVVGEQWILFAQPDSGDYWGNRFDVEGSGEEPVPIEPPDMVPISAGQCPPSPGPQPNPPVTDLSILGIEVTQAIQCFDQSKGYTKCPDNSLELTDGKATAVRVYIGHEGGPKCQPGSPSTTVLKGVCVKLRFAAPHKDLPAGSVWVGEELEQSFDVPCSKGLDKLRENEWGSATFILQPGALGKPGWKKSLWVEAEVIAKNTQESNKNNNKKEVTVPLLPRKPLNLTYMYVYYAPEKSKKYPNNPYTGPPYASKVVGLAAAEMKSMYPMPVNYSMSNSILLYQAGKVKKAPDIRDDKGTLATYLDNAYNLLKPKPDSLIGWLPNGASNYDCQGYAGPPSGWIVECSMAESMLCHEAGHTLDLWHPDDTKYEPCWPFPGNYTIKETGFYVDEKLMCNAKGKDFMAGDGWWISPYNWNRLLKKPYSKGWAKVGPGCASNPSSGVGMCLAPSSASMFAEQQPAILVSGRVHDDGSGELDALYQFTSDGPFPTSDPGADYCLDLQTAAGSTLASHCFELSHRSSTNGTSGDTAGFSFVLAFPDETGRVVLRRGSTVLAERVASPHAPELNIIAPQGGEVISGTTTISWTAADEDGDTLLFAGLYSPDGGESWTPMAFDVEDTNLEVDSTWWAGGENAQIRILASDGFNATTADSAAFEVPRKAPNVGISTPENNALIHPLEAIVLTGHADDLEDGELEGSNLTWASDRHGVLGSGSQLILPGMTLAPGEHEIMLTAMDSDGQTGTASVTALVGHRVYLPIILRNYP